MTRAEKRRQQVARVDAYKAWLAAGSDGAMPCLPSSADFKAWNDQVVDSMLGLQEAVERGDQSLRGLGAAARAGMVGSSPS